MLTYGREKVNMVPDNDPQVMSLREATDDDLEIMLAWRLNPLVFRGFYLQSEPLEWDEHYTW